MSLCSSSPKNFAWGDAEPSYMEPVPSCFTDDAAPLSDSEEDSMADASSGAESDDVEDIQVEVQTPDQPYEDLSCEEGLWLWALQTGQTHRSIFPTPDFPRMLGR